MTAITATIHRPHSTAAWVFVSAALVVAGLVAALVVALTRDSSGSTPSPAPGVGATTGHSGGGAPSLCPGSIKDWTC